MVSLASISKVKPEKRFPPPRGRVKKEIFKSLVKSVGAVAGMARGVKGKREENGARRSTTSTTPAELPVGTARMGSLIHWIHISLLPCTVSEHWSAVLFRFLEIVSFFHFLLPFLSMEREGALKVGILYWLIMNPEICSSVYIWFWCFESVSF